VISTGTKKLVEQEISRLKSILAECEREEDADRIKLGIAKIESFKVTGKWGEPIQLCLF
jgi:hypothetical protein